VTDGVATAVARAQAAAGDQAVVIMGGPSTAQQALAAGLADELRLHIRPILLGGGTRLLDNLPAASSIALRHGQVTSTAAATHLRFDVTQQGPEARFFARWLRHR
jgi:dihydrofolate reductase